MSTTDTRKRGATGVRLDDEKLLAAIAATGADTDRLKIDSPLLLVQTDDRGPCVLLTEGVGWGAGGDGTIDIATIYGLGSGGVYEVPLDAVLHASTGEIVDIADHIRRFGGRLESNFGIWYRSITGESAWA